MISVMGCGRSAGSRNGEAKVRRIILVAAAILPMLVSWSAQAETEAEQTAKNLCAGCHGPTGISTNPLWPNLAGQQDQYTAKQLRAYRDGTRSDPTMSGISQPLTDAQIDALAAYYAKQPADGI
jgi:cytochrome c553